jgi:hypothetical protein
MLSRISRSMNSRSMAASSICWRGIGSEMSDRPAAVLDALERVDARWLRRTFGDRSGGVGPRRRRR